ncbi:MAG: hypothetical protein KME03_08945 [Aphanocapsa lilacina HA4352-LM1]|jgi:putative intracellular protease/amidase|nr:hypothetical protein [Aphanocapsa lilacina HA4352-LM1]
MRTVGIVIFDNVEVLDLCGPFEVFSAARTDRLLKTIARPATRAGV